MCTRTYGITGESALPHFRARCESHDSVRAVDRPSIGILPPPATSVLIGHRSPDALAFSLADA